MLFLSPCTRNARTLACLRGRSHIAPKNAWKTLGALLSPFFQSARAVALRRRLSLLSNHQLRSPLHLWVHDPGCLHDPSAHAHNDVVESAHAQMTILFCDDLRHCTICPTLAHLSLLSSVNTIEGIIFLI